MAESLQQLRRRLGTAPKRVDADSLELAFNQQTAHRWLAAVPGSALDPRRATSAVTCSCDRHRWLAATGLYTSMTFFAMGPGACV